MLALLFCGVTGAASCWQLFPRASVHARQAALPPTPALASQPGIFITVTTTEPQINVRAGPSSAVYPIVGFLLRGATAPAHGRSIGGDWIQIEYPGAPNDRGWVYAPLVAVSPGILAIVEPPPTPIPPPTSTVDPTLAAQFNIVPTATRLATFTPPPPMTWPALTSVAADRVASPVPWGPVIVALWLLGAGGLLLSLARGG